MENVIKEVIFIESKKILKYHRILYVFHFVQLIGRTRIFEDDFFTNRYESRKCG